MYTVRKNNISVEVLTVLVYAENRNTLWDYRNLIQKIESMVSGKLELSLTVRYYTVLDILKFDVDPIDIYIIDSNQGSDADKWLEQQIWRKYPDCHGLRKENNSYAYSSRSEDGIWHVMHTNRKEVDLEKFLIQIIEKIREKQKNNCVTENANR